MFQALAAAVKHCGLTRRIWILSEKGGTSFRIQRERDAIAFVQKYTSVAVPSIFDVTVRGHESWILMQRAPGIRLDLAWPDIPENIKATIIT